MARTIILTGGTGLIGVRVARALAGRGDRVVAFSRHPERARELLPFAQRAVLWSPGMPGAWRRECLEADALVNLAGEPIAAGRWSPERKRRILESRVLSTRSLVDALHEGPPSERAFVCASAAGWYGHRGEEELDEASAPGDDFLAGVCAAWEREAAAAAETGARVVSLRIAMALAADGGALARMLRPYRLRAGGPLGSGRQWMPWIHIDDLVRLVLHALDTPAAAGPLNASAPEPLRNADFSAALGRALGRPSLLRAPAFALRLALGEMASMLLASQRVRPRATLASGFTFAHGDIDGALADLLRRTA